MARKSRTPNDRGPRRRPDADAARPSGGVPAVPGWLPWTLYGVLTLVLFREFVFSDRMLLGGDTLSLGYVARAFYAEALANGTFPLWAPRILGGTPFVDALSGGDSLYPPSLALLAIMDPHRALGWKLVLHIFTAGLLMFAWVRALGVSRAAALVAGAGYMLAPMLVSFVRPGHDGKLFVMSLAPLLFWAVERFFAGRKASASGFAAIGLVVALVISTTHFQMAWFLFLAAGAYAVFRATQMARGTDRGTDPRAGHTAPVAGSVGRAGGEAGDPAGATEPGPGRPRGFAPAGLRFGLFLAASVAGAAAAGAQLLPAVEYVTEYSRRVQTTRAEAGETGTAWSSSWSIHPEEAMSLLIPQFAGNNADGSAWSSGTYWGRNGFKDNHENSGLVVLLLAAVAFVGGRRRGLRFFLAGLGTVAFLFALGANTPVWRLFYEVVPGIRLFRAPSQAMFLFSFAAATLAALGVDRLLRGTDDDEAAWKPVQRVLLAGTGLMVLLSLLAASGALTSIWTTAVWPGNDPARLRVLEVLQPFIVRGAFVGALLTAGVTGAAWALQRARLAPSGLLAALLLLVAVDGFRVDGTFVQTMDFHEWAEPEPLIQAILDQEAGSDEPYRLASWVRAGQDVKPSLHGIELATGHHPNDLSRYRELIGMVGSGEPRNLGQPNVRMLLNVKYLLWPDAEQGRGLGGEPIAQTQLRDGRVYQSLYADAGLPRARLVGTAVVKSDDEAVPYILSDAHDPRVEAVLAEGSPTVPLAGRPVDGTVRWVLRTPNRLELEVTSDGPALLVVADNWFPAWKAEVNGQEAPVLRAYHTLRAVPVAEGASTVVLEYRSEILARSAWISVLVLLGLVAAALVGLLGGRRRAGAGMAATGGAEAAAEAGGGEEAP